MAATLTNISQWVSGGASKMQYATSSSGRPYDSSSLTAGNESGMTDVEGFRVSGVSFPQPRILQIEGDDGVRGSIIFPSNSTPTFTLAFSDMNIAFLDAVQGTTADDAQSTYDMAILDPTGLTFPDLFIMITRRAVSTEAGSEGNGYESLVFPLCTGVFTGPGDFNTGDNAGEYSFQLTVNRVSQLPWGETLTSGAHGTTEASGFMFWSEKIPTFDVFIQNNSDTSWTLTKTLASNSQAIAWDGAAGASASTLAVTISTNDLTFTAQTSGNITTALYERV